MHQTRRVVIVSTATPERLRAALPAGAEWVDVPRPGRGSAVAGTLPGGEVARAVGGVRLRCRAMTGAAVADATEDPVLLRAAEDAMAAGHGIADDRDEQARRDAVVHGTRTGVRAAVLRAVRARYNTLGSTGQRVALSVTSFALGWGVPFLTYSVLWELFGLDVGPAAFWVVFTVLLVTSVSIYAEILRALEPERLPGPGDPGFSVNDPLASGRWPTVTVILAAFLPNEADVLPASVEALLAHAYPGRLEVLVAGNGSGPQADAVLAWLRRRAAADSRLRIVLSPRSSSKAENVNAAVHASQAVADGGLVGVLDADHHLAAGALTRAARWVGGGYADVVQGHNVVRNGDDSRLAQMVAVEFESIYALAHPGRAGLHGFGIFGGSNGFWRADLLDRLRMRPWMLTEDIDVSIRALLAGARVTSDPQIVSRELAPETLGALWGQRTRWAQGWNQVSRRQLRTLLAGPGLSARQRVGAFFLLGWREAYPWLAMQMVPILAYDMLVRRVTHIHWGLPAFLFATLLTSAVGPVQALVAWRLSVPEIRIHKRWLLRYLLLQGPVYGEAKSLVNRCAHLREWIGDGGWVVTPRSGDAAITAGLEVGPTSARPRVIGLDPDGVLRNRPLGRARPGRQQVPA